MTVTTYFPYRLGPLSNIAPFTYQEGETYQSLLERMRVYLTETVVNEFDAEMGRIIEDFQAGVTNTEQFVTDAIQFINNKTGDAEIQHTVIDDPYTVIINPLWPDNHPVMVSVQQDGDGGHTISLGGNIVGSIEANLAPHGITRFHLVPQGDGSWLATTYVDRDYLDPILYELGQLIGTKADTDTVNAALALKANASSLALKADKATTIATTGPMVAVLGVIRNTGTGWALINDSGHTPVNIDTVTSDSSTITVTYTGAAASKVGTFLVVPDETLAQQGFTAGASVAAGSATIYLGRTVPSYSDYVAYVGAGGWVSSNGVFTPTWDAINGLLKLEHPQVLASAMNVSLTGRPGTALNYTPVIAGDLTTGSTFIGVEFRDSAGNQVMTPDTNMRVFATHGGGHQRTIDPSTVTTTDYPNHNLWLLGLMHD